ncbi:hypothetical protein [Clostridium sp.]|uniref:hypothetical protein n=1 Tax=Clostridium sp. TaxID=1506 RepID=UPI00260BB822|nr:hypothetical protein [Clostridium sp.]
MKLDEIIDIEVLKNKLKGRMTKCKKNYKKDNILILNKGEYYDVEQDQDYIYIYPDDSDEIIIFTYEEAIEYLDNN